MIRGSAPITTVCVDHNPREVKKTSGKSVGDLRRGIGAESTKAVEAERQHEKKQPETPKTGQKQEPKRE